ncbi:bacteriorhodopsin [Spirosoma sp.]|uniref:bacteriorhodopsin n=1 Tax=Spirosoma sp. TaxID=1899569 RepID=UPI0026366E08|nr:bacteriorhodopsin [Spirosoma sp.]MCX6218884.1 bacteriorhodopsin [Spirosoma sp.]
MEIADSFVPTAGVVGILPLVTYFFLVVATYTFVGTFIAALAVRPAMPAQHDQSLPLILTAVTTAIAGFSYYQIQGYYHDMLAELVTVTDPENRQVLIRESYNAIGQYRFMDWAVTIPLLLIQALTIQNTNSGRSTRTLVTLVTAGLFTILTGYIGHQQLAFDNEIMVGPKLIWGAISMLGYAFIGRILLGIWRQSADQVQPDERRISKLVATSVAAFAVAYPIGYVLSLTAIDFNLIHILYTTTDLISKVGLGLAAYFTLTKTIQSKT